MYVLVCVCVCGWLAGWHLATFQNFPMLTVAGHFQSSNRLTRDITLDDLEPEDHYILESGCMQISNKLKDTYGRHLYIGCPHLRPFESPSEAMVSGLTPNHIW